MTKWIAEFDLEDGDTMPEHMELEYKGTKIDFHCRPMGINALPSAQPLTEEDYIELHDRFGTWVEEVVRDMISGEGKRWGNERRHDQQTGGD